MGRILNKMAMKLRVQDLKEKGYKDGSIIRVQMVNFLTYDECEVTPGPRLNIVIGPNGTGKSTLTHAICLACGGSTSDVGTVFLGFNFFIYSGRSSDLSKFVKHGKEGSDCFVEVDVLNGSTISTIRRILSSESKGSKWTLNGKASTQAIVKELVKDLCIDVDNLCSFMPQDKVGEFSRFNAKDVLKNTLKAVPAVEGKSLFEEQRELSNMEVAKDELRRNRDLKQTTYDSLCSEYDKLKVEVDRLKRREELKEKIKLCQFKLVKLESDENAQALSDAQKELDAATNRQQEEERAIAPLQQKERTLKEQQAAREQAAEQANHAMNQRQKALKTALHSVEGLDREVEELGQDIGSFEKTRKEKQTQLHDAVEMRDSIRKDYETAKNRVAAIPEQLQVNRQAVKQVQDEISNIQDHIQQLNGEVNTSIDPEIHSIQRELRGLKDQKQIYLNRMRNMGSNQDVTSSIKAFEWLQKNEAQCRREGRLTGQIYGPIAMYCSVTDEAIAVMLEKVVPVNRLMGFVVENDQDAQFLKDIFRNQLRSKVDVYTVKNSDISRMKHMQPYSAQEVASFQDMGVVGYLYEQLQCPDMVMSALWSFSRMGLPIWGRSEARLTDRHLSRLVAPDKADSFAVYMHSPGRGTVPEVIEYSGKRSRYQPRGSTPSTQTSFLHAKGFFMNQQGGVGETELEEKRARLTVRMNDLEALKKEKTESIDNARNEVESLQKKIDSLKTLRMELERKLNEPKKVAEALKRQEEVIARYEKFLSQDMEKEKKQMLKNYTYKMEQYLKCLEDVPKLAKAAADAEVDAQVYGHFKGELLNNLYEIRDEIKNRQAGLEQFRQAVKAARTRREAAKAKVAESDRKLEEMVEREGGLEHFRDVIYPRVVELVPQNTVAEVEQVMFNFQAEFNRTVENRGLVEKFKQVEAERDQVEQELKEAADRLDDADTGLKNRATMWLENVHSITAKLNASFQKFMRDLQFDGEVLLRETGGYDDFELQLRVRFREDSQLTDLSGTRNSGGERAVATVMYLMALQEMTSSPFRVVDEINQGMDERNERLVFDRIVNSCCGDATKPQYFLVSPKLLQGLRAMDNDDVTVLLVWNGPGITKKFTFTEICKQILQQEKAAAMIHTAAGEEDGHSEDSDEFFPGDNSNKSKKKRAVGSDDDSEEEAKPKKSRKLQKLPAKPVHKPLKPQN